PAAGMGFARLFQRAVLPEVLVLHTPVGVLDLHLDLGDTVGAIDVATQAFTGFGGTEVDLHFLRVGVLWRWGARGEVPLRAAAEHERRSRDKRDQYGRPQCRSEHENSSPFLVRVGRARHIPTNTPAPDRPATGEVILIVGAHCNAPAGCLQAAPTWIWRLKRHVRVVLVGARGAVGTPSGGEEEVFESGDRGLRREQGERKLVELRVVTTGGGGIDAAPAEIDSLACRQ